jgi:hypothetical protein
MLSVLQVPSGFRVISRGITFGRDVRTEVTRWKM